MKMRRGGLRRLAASGIGFFLAAAWSPGAEPTPLPFTAGVMFDHMSRTVVWEGETETSRVAVNCVSLRAGFDLGRGVTLGLSAGLALSDFDALAFLDLPISLELGSSVLKGVALAAEIEAVLLDLGDFEIGAAGRVVSSFGLARTWTLEDFAVPGRAEGRTNWMEASAAPRLAYHLSGGFVPYLEVAARWFRVDVRMKETLEDLQDAEKKRIKGDFSLSASLGGDIRLSDRLVVRAKAGIVPHAGGAGVSASLGLLFAF